MTPIFLLETPSLLLETPRFSWETPSFSWEDPIFHLRPPDFFIGDPKIFIVDHQSFIKDPQVLIEDSRIYWRPHGRLLGDPKISLDNGPNLFFGDPKNVIKDLKFSFRESQIFYRRPQIFIDKFLPHFSRIFSDIISKTLCLVHMGCQKSSALGLLTTIPPFRSFPPTLCMEMWTFPFQAFIFLIVATLRYITVKLAWFRQIFMNISSLPRIL